MKWFLKLIGGLIVAFVVIGFLFPASYQTKLDLMVDKSDSSLYTTVSDLKTWKKWSYWEVTDTAMRVTYGAKTQGLGAAYTWGNKESAIGTLTIVTADPYRLIEYEAKFDTDLPPAKGWYSFKKMGDRTLVESGFYMEHGYNPLNRWFGILFGQEMDKAIEHNLYTLRDLKEINSK
ncbi:MAG: hypothetical protein ACK48F_16645 [Chryseotalea sp.]